MTLRVYEVTAELNGILIFSSEQRPALRKPGGLVVVTHPVIHNYPLLYSLLGLSAEAYAVIPSLHTQGDGLQYTTPTEAVQRFARGEEGAVYIFPLAPVKVRYGYFVFSSKGTGYADYRGKLKVAFPRLVSYAALVPPTTFRTLVACVDTDLPNTMYLRIGMKRMGAIVLRLREARVARVWREPRTTTLPVNMYDIRVFGYYLNGVPRTVVLSTRSRSKSAPEASVLAFVTVPKLVEVTAGQRRFLVPLPDWVRHELEASGHVC